MFINIVLDERYLKEFAQRGIMAGNKAAQWGIVFIALVLLAVVLKELQSFFRPLAIAFMITLLLMPLVRFSKRKRIPFLVTMSAIVLIFISIGVLLVALGYADTTRMGALPEQDAIQSYLGEVQSMISGISIMGQPLRLEDLFNVDQAGQLVAKTISIMISAVRKIATELFFVILFVIFLVPSIPAMCRGVEARLTKKDAKKFVLAINQVEASTIDYLVTKSGISICTALVSGIILWLFGANFIVMGVLLIFTLNFIPNIGSIIAVLIVLGGYALTVGLGAKFAALSALLISVQIVFGNYLEPKIAGNRLNLNPLIVIGGLFIWGYIWGIIGMLIAVPLTSIIKIILSNIESTKTIARMMG